MLRTTIVVLLVGASIFAGVASARTSLTSLDAKLDELLAQGRGFDPARIVNLQSFLSNEASCSNFGFVATFRRAAAAGLEEFVVPEGHVLLLTDLHVTTRFSGVLPSGASRSYLLAQAADAGILQTAFRFTSAPSPVATSAPDGSSGSFDTPILVPAGNSLCAEARYNLNPGGETGMIVSSHLNGILIPLGPAASG